MFLSEFISPNADVMDISADVMHISANNHTFLERFLHDCTKIPDSGDDGHSERQFTNHLKWA